MTDRNGISPRPEVDIPSRAWDWLAYLPLYIVEELLANPASDPVGREQRFEAVALFADVSGFTPISEALGAAGRQGTEELTEILNSYFEPMIDLIHGHGGMVAKFGGDALTVVFPYVESSRANITRCALQCALEMQRAMVRYQAIPTSGGVFALTMKAGVAGGRLFTATLGDGDSRLEHIVAGSVLDRCAEAEHRASRGEVVVHNDLLEWVDGVEVAEERNGYSLIADLDRPADPTPPSLPDQLPASARQTCALYIPPQIARRIEEDRSGLIDEHRQVTVLFARFEGFDYDDDPQVGTRLQSYLGRVLAIIHRYGGELNKVDMGDKGSKFIVLFGAPIAHEDDPERALHCALALVGLDVPVGIGINSGLAYCGRVGSSLRREYTVMGESVVLAARLMQAARPGQVLVSAATQQQTGSHFHWDDSEQIAVKGKRTPVTVFALQAAEETVAVHLQEPAYDLPMVGRQRELERARAALAESRAGRGQVLGITAEAGMGKSRLAAEIGREAAVAGMTILSGAGQSYGRQSSYLVWRSIWRDFFGLSAQSPLDEQFAYLEAVLTEMDPGLVQRLPLLAAPLNLPIPDNALTRSLEPQERAEMLRFMLLDCLRVATRQRSLLVVLEDCHWIDPLSQELLAFLGRNLADLPVLMLLLYRPQDTAEDPLAWAGAALHAQVLELKELSLEEGEALARAKITQLWGQGDSVAGALSEQLATKAQGNPFYLEEMVNLLHDRDVDLTSLESLDDMEIPDSLHSLVLSRIDRLEEGEKTALKVASVIGRTFAAAWVWGSYPQAGDEARVIGYLERLRRLDLTPLHASEPDLEYIFKHVTTQEVAYESLAYAMRADLHDQVGSYVETRHGEDLSGYLDVLAYHFGRSRNVDKQRLYFRRAGDAARASYANDAAIDYYQRLLPLLPEGERGEVEVDLGEVRQLTGDWTGAESLYREALAQAEEEKLETLQARCLTALGTLLCRTESHERGLAWLEQALEIFERLGDDQGIARAMEQISFACSHLGDFERALACARRQLEIAQAQGDLAGISAALDYMGVAYFHQGELDQAQTHLERSLTVALEVGDRRRESMACNDLAGVLWQQGAFGHSITYLQQAAEAAAEIGYRQVLGLNLGNQASLYGQMGAWDQALDCASHALALASELGDGPVILSCLVAIAWLFEHQEMYAVASALYAHATELSRNLSDSYSLCISLHELSRVHHVQGHHAIGLEIAQEALTLAEKLEFREYQFKLRLLTILLHFGLELLDTVTAVAELESLNAGWPEEEQQAALHYEIWRLDGSQEESRQKAAQLYRQLHERTPDIEYRQHYAELTGEQLPGPKLPPLPDTVRDKPVNLTELLARIGIQFG